MVISVNDYKQIRKCYLNGESQRSIAKSTDSSRNPIKKYCEGENVPWERIASDFNTYKAWLQKPIFYHLEHYVPLLKQRQRAFFDVVPVKQNISHSKSRPYFLQISVT